MGAARAAPRAPALKIVAIGAPIPSADGPAVASSLRLDLDFEFVNGFTGNVLIAGALGNGATRTQTIP